MGWWLRRLPQVLLLLLTPLELPLRKGERVRDGPTPVQCQTDLFHRHPQSWQNNREPGNN